VGHGGIPLSKQLLIGQCLPSSNVGPGACNIALVQLFSALNRFTLLYLSFETTVLSNHNEYISVLTAYVA